jgi:hypothetical protein
VPPKEYRWKKRSCLKILLDHRLAEEFAIHGIVGGFARFGMPPLVRQFPAHAFLPLKTMPPENTALVPAGALGDTYAPGEEKRLKAPISG